MRSHTELESASHRKKSKLLLLMVGLFLVFVEMTVTARAQETHRFTSSELARPVRDLSIHELAQRYGITDAIEFSRQIEAEKDAHRERERFDNPSEVHADSPQLAKKCEELARAIKKLLR